MPLIQIIVVLIVIGVLLYIVESLLPIDPTIKQIIRIVILLAVVIWLLALVGLLPGGTLRVGHLRAGPSPAWLAGWDTARLLV